MIIQPGGIYFASRATLRLATYPRPCLVLRVSASEIDICYFSTKLDLIRSDDILVERMDPDFAFTGLSDSSYLVAASFHPEQPEYFKGAKHLGSATGD